MIFDPALAAAARRHARAQAKHNKAKDNSAATSSENSGGSVGAATAAPGGNVQQEPSFSGGGGGAAAPSDSGEHAASKVVVGRAERTTSGSSNAGDGGLLSRTASASTNGGDGDGSSARVGPVGPRPRAMKPRVLLKIVVLGCSNVSRLVCVCMGVRVCVYGGFMEILYPVEAWNPVANDESDFSCVSYRVCSRGDTKSEWTTLYREVLF